MKKSMTVYYQFRHGVRGDRPTAPKIVIANHFLTESGFVIGKKFTVEYLKGSLIIKLNSNL